MERVLPAARQRDGRGEGEVVEADRAGLAPLQRKEGVGLDGGRALDAVRRDAVSRPQAAPALGLLRARRARVEARRSALGARRRLHAAPGCPRRCGSEAGSEGATQKCLIGVF